MRIGKKIHEVTEEPRPYRQPARLPERAPEREPVAVPVRREPSKIGSEGRLGYTVEEIPYSCPYDGEELAMEDGILYCPKHGVIYNRGSGIG